MHHDDLKSATQGQTRQPVGARLGSPGVAQVATAGDGNPYVGEGPISVSGVAQAARQKAQLPPASAHGLLEGAIATIVQRGVDYDRPTGGRSAAHAAKIFNAITGLAITPEQAWLFMIALKLARSLQGKPKVDTYVDLAGYAALLGEEALGRDDLAQFKQAIGSLK